MEIKNNIYSIVALPFLANQNYQIAQFCNLDQIKENIQKNETEINVNGKINLKLSMNPIKKFVYKIQTFRNKKDPTKQYQKLLLEGEINFCYDSNLLEDFHFQTPFTDDQLTQFLNNTITQKQIKSDQIDNLDIISGQEKIFNYLLKPDQFLKGFKHGNAGLFKINDKIKIDSNQEQDLKYIIHSISINFDSQLNEVPNLPEDDKLKQNQLHIKLQKMFEERPIWLKNSLLYYLQQENIDIKQISHTNLKRCLSIIAYHFKNGPWKHCYIKFGYDPRQFIESANYQVLDIAVQDRDNIININHKNNSSIFMTYDPTFKEKPPFYRHLYQICDIQDKNINKLISKALETLNNQFNLKCDYKFGWFQDEISKKLYNRFLRIMKDKFKLR